MKQVCVFCGSALGAQSHYAEAAHQLGRGLATRGLGLVYGGASEGLMGRVAQGALEHGGRVVGVIPKALEAREISHNGLSELHVVGSMHERKALMADMADAFIAMPGGIGTLDELCEIITWAQLGLHHKGIALLNVNGYFDPFIAFLDHAVQEGFIKASQRKLLVVNPDPDGLLDFLMNYRAPVTNKWI
jgi:uncharacterized protein (TIGR00730 family)